MLRTTNPLRSSLAAYSLSALVLIVGAVVSFCLEADRTQRAREQEHQDLQRVAHEVTDTLERRILSYELILRAAKGLLKADEEVIREEWGIFADILGVGEQPDGTFGLALVRAVPGDELRDYEAAVRRTGVPNFTVRSPAGAPERSAPDIHYVIEFHEPARINRPVWGLDVSAVPVNREAYQLACDTGQVWMTPAFTLAQQQREQLGVVLTLPVYRGEGTPTTVEERRDRIDCFIALSVALEPFLGEATTLHRDEYALRVEELDSHGEWATLFQSPEHSADPGTLVARSTPDLPGQRWSVVVTAHADPAAGWLAGLDREFVGGLLISFLLAVLVRIWTRTRANAERLADRMTESLRESESRYRTLVDGNPVCIKELDPSGKILSMNAAGLRMLGLSDESEIVGQLMDDLVLPEDLPQIQREHARILEGETRAFQFRLPLDSGEIAVMETVVVPRRGPDGEVGRMICVTQDVTVRVRAENQLRANEAMLESLTRLAPVGIYRADASGDCVFVTERWCTIAGLDTDSSLVDGWLEAVHPEDRETVNQAWEAFVRDEVPYDLEYRYLRPDGECSWVQDLAVEERDESGGIIGYVGAVSDITARRVAENKIRENEARLENLTRMTPVGIYRADEKGLVMDVSERLVRLTGLSREQACQDDWSPFIHPDDYGPVVEAWDRMVEAQTTFDMEYRLRRRDRGWAWFHVQAVPERDEEGNITGFVGSMADHTDRRAAEDRLRQNEARLRELAEQAQAANRIKGEFLANMSHEIRTPMTAILGFAELLGQSVEPGTEAEDALLTIQRNGEHLLEVVNDVLNISKIEAGQLEVSRVNLDLTDAVGQIFTLLRQKAQAGNTALVVDEHEDAPGVIAADPVRLRQILLNLIGNAVKFTRDGTVRVRTSRGDAPGSVVVEVIDTGIGLDPARAEQIFEPFVQGDSTTTRNYGGTGLGLSISRKIAQTMGGSLVADPNHRGGSRFVLTLTNTEPLHDAMPEAEAAAPPSERAPQDSPCRVLLAEDSADSQRLIAHHLRQAGHDVVTADDGDRAVTLALTAHRRGQPFDLILMDMQMPRLDGYGATAKLRSKGYTGRIVALTAHAMDFEKQRCLDAGCDDYATKPIPRQTLLDLIRARRNAA